MKTLTKSLLDAQMRAPIGTGPCGPATLKVAHNTGDAFYSFMYQDQWRAQSFMALENFTITKVHLKLSKEASPGTLFVAITATDESGHPTGPDLATGTIDGNSLYEGHIGFWYSISLTNYPLINGVKYAIVCHIDAGGPDEKVEWRYSYETPFYIGGKLISSDDGGESWTSYPLEDFQFEVWGIVGGEEGQYPILKVEIVNMVTGVARLDWAVLDDSGDDNAFNCATMPADGSLLRALSHNSTHVIWFSRIASPDPESNFSYPDNWTVTAWAIAMCSLAAKVLFFRVDYSDGHLYRRESNDSGASWGSWADMGDISGDAATKLTCCFKSSTEAVVMYTKEDTSESSQLYYYDLPDYYRPSIEAVYTSRQPAQTFTTGTSVALTNVLLLLARVGEPGTLNVDIFATDIDGLPTGESLGHTTLDGDTFTFDTMGEWYMCTFTPISLSALTKYAIVLDKTGGSLDNCVYWRRKMFGHDFAGGSMCLSNDEGVSWQAYLSSCFMFKVIGEKFDRVYTRKLSSGSWAAAVSWTHELQSISGLSCFFWYDYNVVVSGRNLDAEPGIWTTAFGCGIYVPSNEWGWLYDFILLPDTSLYDFAHPSVCQADTFRFTFIEIYTGEATQSRINHTHGQPDRAWLGYNFREAIPIDEASAFGKVMTYSNNYVWLTNGKGVWRAPTCPSVLNVSNDVLIMKRRELPVSRKSYSKITLDNTGGIYNNFAHLGSELRISLGYHTLEGDQFADYEANWITGFKFISPSWSLKNIELPPGIVGTIEIICADFWTLCYQWKARHPIVIEAETQSGYEILKRIFARVGFHTSLDNASTFINSFEPALTIKEGRHAKWAAKKVLSWFLDQVYATSNDLYVHEPIAADADKYDEDPEWILSGTLDTWRDLSHPFIDSATVIVMDQPEVITYVLGLDYEMDYKLGRINCLSTGDIPADTTIHIFYEAWRYTYDSNYGNAQLVYRGQYGIFSSDPNRAQVWGDTVMSEAYDFPQIEESYPRLKRVTTPDYDLLADTASRAAAEIRKGDIFKTGDGWCETTWNVGLQSWDVVKISDDPAGVADAYYRVLGITTYYYKKKWYQKQRLHLGAV